MSRWALIAAAATALVAPPPPVNGLCGVNPTIDALLGCAAPQSAPKSANSSTLQAAPPVRRTPVHAQYLPGVLLVRFEAQVSTALLHRLHLRVVERTPQLHTAAVLEPESRRAKVTKALQASPLVAGTGRDELLHTFGVTTDDTFFARQWSLQIAGFTDAWQRTRGSHIVVAVVDTGVDATHPDLAGAILPEIDLVNGKSNAGDDNGHGTAVAGVITARANNSLGGAGVCWACVILPIKAMGAGGTGDLGTIALGIVRAADLGARVINLSLGGPAQADVLRQAIDYATAKGAIVVASAGNDGLAVPFYPASYPNVIGVAATDQNDQLYSWSEHGPWVQVAAPGCNVATAPGGGYTEFCGTSSAAPLVSGLAALALSAAPQAGAADVAAAIERATKAITGDLQHGRIDAAGALTALTGRVSRTFTGITTRSYTFSTAGGIVSIKVRFRGARTVTVRLADVASTTGASPRRLTRQLTAGTYRLTISAAKRTSFTVTLAYPPAG